MVNNFKVRTISSLFLITLLFSLYFFKLSHFIFLIFFALVYFELFNNKIINIYWAIVLTLTYCLFLNYDLIIYSTFIDQKLLIFSIFFIITVVSFIKTNLQYSKIILNLLC